MAAIQSSSESFTMNWHCIRLTLEDYQAGELDILMGAFRAAYLAHNGPAGMALFGLWSDDGLSYCVYSTPAAERHLRGLLRAYSAKLENPPVRQSRMDFICGDEAGAGVLAA
jgi:hypothetical protein